MKFALCLVVFCLAWVSGNVSAGDLPALRTEVTGTNRYHVAYVDIKDEGDQGDKKGDATSIGLELYPYLRDLGIRSTRSDDADTDLYVAVRFKHKLMMPELTRGSQIVMTEIGKCSIKIVDKKTEQVLIEKSWKRGKKNGELHDFIKSVFAEFKKQLETNTVPQVPAGPASQMTNNVPSRPPSRNPPQRASG
jgi:hypothetical protein